MDGSNPALNQVGNLYWQGLAQAAAAAAAQTQPQGGAEEGDGVGKKAVGGDESVAPSGEGEGGGTGGTVAQSLERVAWGYRVNLSQ